MGKKGLNLNISNAFVTEEQLKGYQSRLTEGQLRLESGEDEYTGWVDLPFKYNKKEIKRIKDTVVKIQKQCTDFVVIGIGGSYLGARAAIELLETSKTNRPEIHFAGQNISGTYHKELLEKLKDKEVCLCVISKSGTTTETSIAFALLKDWMIKRYGQEEAIQRIYVITDKGKGVLREEVEKKGYINFEVPDNIGGRYSVLTAVGLLPIAVAGIDIEAILEGAAAEAQNKTNGYLYAAVRNELFKRGKVVEIFEYYEPRLQSFSEWLKQLFGESEGKEGKGVFPVALQFSTDLHSMGQFLQQGNQIFFETVLNVTEPLKDLVVPENVGGILANMSMNQVNQAALKGVVAAHKNAGIPIIQIDIPSLTPYYFGQMVYFFERSCALSAYLMGVNPFNQPGVEDYKAEMRKMLKE